MYELYRRGFLALVAGTAAMSVASTCAAQDSPKLSAPKPEIKRSEAKPLIKEYVERMSDDRKKYLGVELSAFEKQKLEHEILTKIEEAGIYNFWDP
ncbi:MAG: hypothetical protein ACR65U_03210 [Methylocystis sp.]